MLSKGITMPGTPHGMELRRAKGSAERWKIKAEQLEQDQFVMKKFVHEAVTHENNMEIQMGRLKQNRDVIHSKMKLREKGLILRRHKEDHFRSDIAELHRRMDEMGRMIRHKEAELDNLRHRDAAQKDEIATLRARLDNKNKGLHQLSEHKMEPLVKSKAGTKKRVRLPTLVTTNAKSMQSSKEFDKESQIGTDKSDVRTVDDDFSRSSQRDMNWYVSSDGAVSCTMVDKTIGTGGGSVALNNTKLTIPPDAIAAPCKVALSNIDMTRQSWMTAAMKSAGMFQLVRPRVHINLQPFDTVLAKNATLQVTIDRDRTSKSKQSRVFVCFMEDMNTTGDDFVWRAEKSSSLTAANDLARVSAVSIDIIRLSGLAILELVTDSISSDLVTKFSDVNYLPNNTKMSPASGIVAMTTAVLNKRSFPCTFVLYALAGDEETLRITCVTSSSCLRESLLLKKNDIKVTHFGTASSRLHVCDEEVLSFYFEKDTKCTGALTVNMSKALRDGHRYRMPFFSRGNQGSDSDESEVQGHVNHPTMLRVRRRIMAPHHMLEDNLCVIHIQSTRRDLRL